MDVAINGLFLISGKLLLMIDLYYDEHHEIFK